MISACLSHHCYKTQYLLIIVYQIKLLKDKKFDMSIIAASTVNNPWHATIISFLYENATQSKLSNTASVNYG